MQKILDFNRHGINYHVFRFSGNYEHGTVKDVGIKDIIKYALSRDANVLVDVTHFIPAEYLRQATEVLGYKYDGRRLDYLAIPLGTGRVFVSFYRALNRLRRKDKQITTRLIGYVPAGENPIYHRFVTKKGGVNIIENFEPKSRAEKLSCPYTDLLPEIKIAMGDGHLVIELDERDIANANNQAYLVGEANLPKNVLELEDSASVGFTLTNLERAIALGVKDLKEGSNLGIFITGMGLYHILPSWVEEKIKSVGRKN